jgi:hypothetical protein
VFQTTVHFLFLGDAIVALVAAMSDARQCVYIGACSSVKPDRVS